MTLLSEEEFVVLMEHAGLVEVFDGRDQEYIERKQLRQWLERDGVELIKERFRLMLQHQQRLENGGETVAMPMPSEPPAIIAQDVLETLLAKNWLRPVKLRQEDADGEGQDDDGENYYALRLATTDAYRIYIDRDSQDATGTRHEWSAEDMLEGVHISNMSKPSTPPVPEQVRHTRIREKMWQDCFPTCPESCKHLYFSFESPVVILYATLGLNLISNGISSVPAFTRELNDMGISAEDRTIITDFLAMAFPCE